MINLCVTCVEGRSRMENHWVGTFEINRISFFSSASIVRMFSLLFPFAKDKSLNIFCIICCSAEKREMGWRVAGIQIIEDIFQASWHCIIFAEVFDLYSVKIYLQIIGEVERSETTLSSLSQASISSHKTALWRSCKMQSKWLNLLSKHNLAEI